MTDITEATPTAAELEAKGNALLDSAGKTSSDLYETATTKGSELLDSATKTASALFSQAQEAIGSAVDTTVKAVKENPVAAAGIAVGTAAAVAGAAYGVSKLMEGDPKPATKRAAPKKKA